MPIQSYQCRNIFIMHSKRLAELWNCQQTSEALKSNICICSTNRGLFLCVWRCGVQNQLYAQDICTIYLSTQTRNYTQSFVSISPYIWILGVLLGRAVSECVSYEDKGATTIQKYFELWAPAPSNAKDYDALYGGGRNQESVDAIFPRPRRTHYFEAR